MNNKEKMTLSVNPEIAMQAREYLKTEGLPISTQFEKGIQLFFQKQKEVGK